METGILMKLRERRRLTLFTFIAILVFTLAVLPHRALAASTTIELTPATGSYGAPFAVSLVIDGHGDVFNAAQATVAVSKSLRINDLVLGDCNFSFMHTPSIANPSFEGAILGGSAKKCTVYTLSLSPLAKGNATITISKATVRRYGDAVEVLSTTQNGSYTLTGTGGAAAQAQATLIPTPANGLYTVLLKVLAGTTTPVQNATVALQAATEKTPLTKMTDAHGTALLTNLKPGAYTVTVTKDKQPAATTVFNVTGPNHVLTLSINLQAQQTNPLLKQPIQQNNFLLPVASGILVVGMLLGLSFALLPRWFKRHAK